MVIIVKEYLVFIRIKRGLYHDYFSYKNQFYSLLYIKLNDYILAAGNNKNISWKNSSWQLTNSFSSTIFAIFLYRALLKSLQVYYMHIYYYSFINVGLYLAEGIYNFFSPLKFF